MKRSSHFLLITLLAAQTVLAADPPLSDAVKAPRPPGGETFGLYLLGKKVGYLYSHLSLVPGALDRVEAISELHFQVGVGNKQTERFHRERRVYQAKPNGKLLSLVVEDKGDGGDRTVEGTQSAQGFVVVRKRAGQPDDRLVLPPRKETVESADPSRVALLRNATVEGWATDAQDFNEYRQTTTVSEPEERTVAGVKAVLRKAITVSEKEKVPVEELLTEDGETVEVRLAEAMRAVAEPASVAKSLERVEVFGLTRIELPNPLPATARDVPGTVRLVVKGLPKKFQRTTPRQQFKPLPGDRIEVTLRAAPPSAKAQARRPLADPSGGEYLKSSLAVESDHPDIKALAKKIVGNERNAYAAAKKITLWVGANLKKEYGASADQASDVLRQLKGDCTEHSLLTVALLRAAGIPARRVDGVVYLMNEEDKVPALYWHEWVEAYVGEWTQLDPTFMQPVADATHFALGEEANAEITLLIGQLKVLEAK